MSQLSRVHLAAIAMYLAGQISEGQLTVELGTVRVEARQLVAEFLNTALENAQVPVARIQGLEAQVKELKAIIATYKKQESGKQILPGDLPYQRTDEGEL